MISRAAIRLFVPVVIGGLYLIGAQNASAHAFNFGAGLFNFDLSGTGNAPSVFMSVDGSLTEHWILEGGLTVAFPDQQFDRTKLLIPEAQVQYQWPIGRFAPFVGGGPGIAIDVRDDRFGDNRTDFALSGGGGVRVSITDSLGVRGEFRLLGFGTHFSGSAAELRGGLFIRF
jgi:hypothetical protein